MFVSICTSFSRRLIAWLSALLIVAATAGPGGERVLHARAEQQTIPSSDTSQFILRASPADVEAIAARHGLIVISRVGDQDVYLVSRSAQTSSGFTQMSPSSANEIAASVELDPQVANFETNEIGRAHV